jgi:hypothetical protein
MKKERCDGWGRKKEGESGRESYNNKKELSSIVLFFIRCNPIFWKNFWSSFPTRILLSNVISFVAVLYKAENIYIFFWPRG